MLTISVVIATHNRASLLQSTLEQLRRQHYEPGDEVIVVDNASTDATAEVIARAAEGFPVPLHRRHDLSPGKAPALNAAIAVARGDILALTDDDVLVADDWIVTIRRVFRDPSIAIVGGRVDPRWQRPAPAWLRVEQQGRYGPMSSPLALLHYGEAQELGKRTAVGANMAVRRAVFEALGGFAPHLGKRRGTLLGGEDHELCRRAAEGGYRCEYRPELFWSGVTNAVIEGAADAAAPGRRAPSPRHLLRRFVVGLVSAPVQALSGRAANGAAQAMDAAFALGYLATQVSSRWNIERQEGIGDEQPVHGPGGRSRPGSPGDSGADRRHPRHARERSRTGAAIRIRG
jgi:glycosyltransferase involved in cell wall biosynthesis